MKLEIALIRHGQVYGSGETRLIGKTDDPLCDEGKKLILARKAAGVYPKVELVFSSEILRCFETAQIIYPEFPVIVTNGLNAPDYGRFEGKLYAELAKDESFGQWVSKKNIGRCLEVEGSHAHFLRSAASFRKICDEMAAKGLEQAAVISHKIVITSILQRYVIPRSDYVDWDILPGGGYLLEYDTMRAEAEITKKLHI